MIRSAAASPRPSSFWRNGSASLRWTTSPRSRATSTDSSGVRLGASATQKGMLGGWPPASARCRHSLREHVDDLIEIGALQIAVGIGLLREGKEVVLLPLIRRAGPDDLLGEHVQRLLRHADRVERALPNGADERGALDQ